ncbi:hypothetical protein [Lacihabitans sp. LS3-19]|uniref:hypothetical protein n=1 Tax=Lacihabitans sp. LS3-19 TaxID=2487335 RepID=UPI0020CC35BA|nr:hypothetical protein [Lacihabitans sp. LS3-19]
MKKVILIIVLLILALIGWYISTGYFSSGKRAGTISKLSERGYVFKTTEGVLNEGGYSGETGTLTPRYWDFSAKDDSVVTKLNQALSTGERITLVYHEKFVKFPWNGDTKYFIVDVLFLGKKLEPAPQQVLPPPTPTPIDTNEVVVSTTETI